MIGAGLEEVEKHQFHISFFRDFFFNLCIGLEKAEKDQFPILFFKSSFGMLVRNRKLLRK